MNRTFSGAVSARIHGQFCRLLILLFVFVMGGFWSSSAHAASFNVTYTDSAGEGFLDPSLGTARRNAFQASLAYWANKLSASPVVISVSASFDPLGGSATSATLGQAGPVSAFRDFGSTNSEYKTGTFYGSSLANHLAGHDLDSTNPEIKAQFNTDVDGAVVLGNTSFYYGTDSNSGSNVDFFSVALHEIGHGLNFLSLINQDGSYTNAGYPGVYDTYLTLGNGANRTRLTATDNAGRASAIISDNLYFDGSLTQVANGNTPAKIYAPTGYQGGSSVSHLDETFYSGLNANNLMTPVYSGPTHDAGPVGLAVFDDMGWALGSSPLVISITRLDVSPTENRSVRFQVLFNSPVTGVDTSDFSVTATGGISGATVTSVSGSNTTYIVTVSGYSGSSGTLKLNLVDDDTIVDAGSALKLGGTGINNGNYSAGESYTFSPPSTSGVASVLSVNANNDGVLTTTPPSTTPTRFGSLFQSNAVSYGAARASNGIVYALASNFSLVNRIPASGGTATFYNPATNLLQFPIDIVVGTDGLLYVASNNNSSIVKVDPNNAGAQTLFASGGSLANPRGLVFGSDGALYVGNISNSTILRLDASTGAQTLYATINGYNNGTTITGAGPWGIAFGPDASLYVSDYFNNRIVKVAQNGTQTDLVAAGSISKPRGMAFGGDGFLYVAVEGSNTIVKINPATGAQTTVATGGELNVPSDVALVPAALPVVSLSGPVSVTEGNSGTKTLAFTLTRTGDTSLDSTVTVATADGSATAGSDYVAIPATNYTFVAGDNTAKTINVTINGDTTFEADETFTLNLSTPLGATLGTSSATGTILNDDVSEPSGSARLIVTTTQDVTATDGLTSLREAIAYANSNPGADTISFNISGSGVQTIQLASALPTLSGTDGAGTIIDGYTQSGASANTLATGTNAVLKIEIRGTGTATTVDGLRLGTTNCTVKGISFVNCRYGVYLPGIGTVATGNKVIGNTIGVRADGTTLANSTGVYIESAANNTVGGTLAGEGNVISGNTNAGITITASASTGNRIRANSIYANGTTATAVGIDLVGTAGVDTNDTNDVDTGPNGLQNYPVLNSATSSGGNTIIGGTLNSTVNTTFTLDFYSSPTVDTSGYGEGQTYLGSTSVTTSGNNATFNTTLTGVTVASGAAITATATDPSGNTSEFSLGIANNVSVSVSLSPSSPTTNQTLTANATPSNFIGTPTYSYEWKVGGVIKQTGTSNIFDLSVAGNGDRGQSVTCTVTATLGAQSAVGSATATIINSAPVITTSSLPSGAINVTYGPVSLAASDADGDTSLTWTVSNGTLPTGITLSSAGVLSGTPTVNGVFSFTVAASDTSGGTGSKALSLTIASVRGVKISELRFSGPQGALDEFVELGNTTGAAIDLSGWTLTAGSVLVTIPSGRTIPAYGHFLLVNPGTGAGTGYSLGTYAAGDVTYSGDIDPSSTLTLKDIGGATMDTLGAFSTQPASSTNQYSFARRLEAGYAADSDSSNNDFNLVDISSTNSTVDGTGVGPLTAARLGAPGPQNRFSPIQNNLGIALGSINIPGNGLAGTAVIPDARYVSKNSTIDPKGRLSLRRTITNNTGATVTQMRFRIVAITAGTNTTSGVADVRPISSGGVRYYASDGSTIQQAAWPVVLEKPSLPTEAPLTATSGSTGKGGGLNSAWTIALPGGSLAPGASVGAEFLFGIVTDGQYRVVVDTELLP
ncbi:serine/threonine-protein kinase PknD [Abditibacteriota bacterium]|nr:serine/threonine-protein kinase PknD [Abditibacteriota bacterium]